VGSVFDVTGSVTACPVTAALASIRSVEGGSACLKTFRINLVLVGEIKRRIGHFEL